MNVGEPTPVWLDAPDYCRFCGQWSGHWAGCPGDRCETCHGEAVVERTATPDEVDAGCELGIAYDPCPACRRRLPS